MAFRTDASPPLVGVRIKATSGVAPEAAPQQSAVEEPKAGWNAANRSARETRTVGGQVEAAANQARTEAGQAVSELAGASVAAATAQPLELMKLVKDGEVEMSLPLKKGTLLTGSLAVLGQQVGPDLKAVEVRQPTELKLHARVENGKLLPKETWVEFKPPLQGPAWGNIEGVRFDERGQAKVSVKGLPDPSLGPPVSLDMKELAAQLARAQERGSTDMSLLGIKLASVEVPGTAAALSLAERVLEPTGAEIALKNVQLQGGEVSLGSAGTVKLAPGSRLEGSGSFTDFHLQGHVDLAEVNVHQDGLLLKGSAGAADLAVSFTRGAGGRPEVSAQLDNLNIKTDYAVTQRKNGDFIELAQGALQGGSIRLQQVLAPGGAHLTSLNVKAFDGELKRAQLTVPDAQGTATVRVNGAHVSGNFEIGADSIVMHGALTHANASVEGYQGMLPGASADVQRLSIAGSATVDLDSRQGALRLAGQGQVEASVKGLKVGSAGISLDAATAQVSGVAEASFDSQTGGEVKGELKLTASLEDAKIDLPGVGSFDVKRGSTVDGVLKQLAFGPHGARVTMQNARIDAQLDRGTLMLPSGTQVDVKEAKVGFRLEELSGGSEGIPTARGSMELDAKVSVRDARNLQLPGVRLGAVSKASQSLAVRLGEFSIRSDGQFEASKMTYSVAGQVERFSARIEAPQAPKH